MSVAGSKTNSGVPGGDFLGTAWYRLMQFLCWILVAAVFRIRVTGRHHVPVAGGVLLVSNHQSFLDPVLVGIGLRRQCHYLARSTLFKLWGFRWLIKSVNAVAIEREGFAIAALRSCVSIVREGGVMVLFPEMTRTHDGAVHKFHRGLALIAKRTGAPVVPVAIDGAFDAWPRSRLLPRPATIRVMFGAAICAGEFAGSDAEMVKEIESRVSDMRERLAEKPRG